MKTCSIDCKNRTIIGLTITFYIAIKQNKIIKIIYRCLLCVYTVHYSYA